MMTVAYAETDTKRRSFDRDHLSRYTMQCAELEREILSLFLDQLNQSLTNLRAANTRPEWNFLAHTLKGSALSVGALRIADIASALEVAAVFENLPVRRQQLEQLAIEAANFEQQLKLCRLL